MTNLKNIHHNKTIGSYYTTKLKISLKVLSLNSLWFTHSN